MKKVILFNVCLLCVVCNVSQAQLEVAAGYDLFETDEEATDLLGFDMEGVAIRFYDFGGSVGTKDVGLTDTIIRRIGPAKVVNPSETDTIQIELVALQLKSVDMIDLGSGLGYHYITLQSGTPSLGTMAITFDDHDGGTFDSVFPVFFDVRMGSLDGPIVISDVLDMSSLDNPWGRISPSGAEVIEGVNYLLDGVFQNHDFWPGTFPNGDNAGPVVYDAAGEAHHVVNNPEPTTIVLLGLGGLALLRKRRA